MDPDPTRVNMPGHVTPLIAVDGLVKRYGGHVALAGVGFTVMPGEIVGLLGPNGAGKSTTLGVLATQLGFEAGAVAVAGHALPGGAHAARRALGLVPQQVAVYPTLSARENLRFSKHPGSSRRSNSVQIWAEEAAQALVDRGQQAAGYEDPRFCDRVSVGELAFDILHCPGHSPGSVVFFNNELRFAHVGDVLFSGSVGRSDIPGGNHATLIKSIIDKLLPPGDDVAFICGHGPGSSIGQERMTNPFLTGAM